MIYPTFTGVEIPNENIHMARGRFGMRNQTYTEMERPQNRSSSFYREKIIKIGKTLTEPICVVDFINKFESAMFNDNDLNEIIKFTKSSGNEEIEKFGKLCRFFQMVARQIRRVKVTTLDIHYEILSNHEVQVQVHSEYYVSDCGMYYLFNTYSNSSLIFPVTENFYFYDAIF